MTRSSSNLKQTPKPPSKPVSQKELSLNLAQDVKELTKEIQKLKNSEFLKVFAHPWKFMGFSLLKGMMVGLGSIIGATVLVGLLIYLLSKISLVPIIGDFVKDVMNQIQTESQSTVPSSESQSTVPSSESSSTVPSSESSSESPSESPPGSAPPAPPPDLYSEPPVKISE